MVLTVAHDGAGMGRRTRTILAHSPIGHRARRRRTHARRNPPPARARVTDEPHAAAERRLEAFTFMFGALDAIAANSPPVRDALLRAIEGAWEEGYLTAGEALAHRRRIARWAAELGDAAR